MNCLAQIRYVTGPGQKRYEYGGAVAATSDDHRDARTSELLTNRRYGWFVDR